MDKTYVFHFASVYAELIQGETRKERVRRSAYTKRNNQTRRTSTTFIHIHFTVVTRPARFAETGVLGALFGANSSVFTRIRITRVLLASLSSCETSNLYVRLQCLAQDALAMKQKDTEIRNERFLARKENYCTYTSIHHPNRLQLQYLL